MLAHSAEYDVAIDAPSRYILPKLLVNFGSTITLGNGVNNGDFASATLWLPIGCTRVAVDNVLSATGDGTAAVFGVYQDNPVTKYDDGIYMVKIRFRVTDAACVMITVQVNGTTGGTEATATFVDTPEIDTWYEIYGYFNWGVDWTGDLRVTLCAEYANAGAASGKVLECTYVVLCNLTQAYGAGNEPEDMSPVIEELENHYIDGAVILYVDAYTEFGSETIMSMTLLEEMKAEGSNVLGNVSANELSVILNNLDGAFTLSNTSSPYYGKLKPNLKVIASLIVRTNYDEILEEWNYEEISLGTFYTGTWGVTSEKLEAPLICYDRLYFMNNLKLPLMRSIRNMTYAQLFEILFQSVELTSDDYTIDATLTEIVPEAWFTAELFIDALRSLCVAARSNAYVSRDGKLTVVKLDPGGMSVLTMDDLSQVTSVTYPTRYNDLYSTVSVKVYNHTLDLRKEVATLTVTLPAEGQTFQNIPLSSPVAYIEHISLQGIEDTRIASIEYSPNKLSIWIANFSYAPQEITIRVYGIPFASNASVVEEFDDDAITLVGLKTLSIDNILIQDYNYANDYAEDLLNLSSKESNKLIVNCRGNPALELRDVIKINDTADKVVNLDIFIYRQTLRFMPGLEATIEGFFFIGMS